MANVLMLYSRPVGADTGWPALSVTGTLPGYRSGDPFEGRLQINNPVGDCTVELLSGTLPPAASLRVDNTTHEVVIEWPEYTAAVEETPTPIPNASFEQGDVLWRKGAGWTIQNFGAGPLVTDGAWSAVFSNASGTGDLIGLPVPIATNEPITLSCDIQQGGSSSGNVSARVALVWFNGTMQMPEASLGNVIIEGSSGAWATSTVTASKPAGATHVAAGVTASRKRQNKPLFVDNFRWNLSYPTGMNDSDVDYFLSLKVTDSAGRVAYWSGIISEHYIYLTSLPYTALAGPEAMTVEPFFVGASTKLGLITFDQPWEDALTVAPFFVSALTKSLNWTHPQPAEDFLIVSPIFVSASIKTVMISHVQPQEDNLTVSPFFTSASTKVVLVNNTIPFEALTVSPFFVSASTS